MKHVKFFNTTKNLELSLRILFLEWITKVEQGIIEVQGLIVP